MAEKILMKGNEAIAESAIRAGCKMFFGYPITPQTELAAYMAKKLPKIEGGVFLQAESEVSAINMVYGAAGAGGRPGSGRNPACAERLFSGNKGRRTRRLSFVRNCTFIHTGNC